MLRHKPHACTDVTGFGLGGHVLEMARGSHVEITIHSAAVPVIAEARQYASMGLIPAGSYATKHYCEGMVIAGPEVPTVLLDLVFDSQTSGGLVIAVPADEAQACIEALRAEGVVSAALVGEVTAPSADGKVLVV